VGKTKVFVDQSACRPGKACCAGVFTADRRQRHWMTSWATQSERTQGAERCGKEILPAASAPPWAAFFIHRERWSEFVG